MSLINREAAIDAVNTIFAVTPTQKDVVMDCIEAIVAVPPAQPEPCEDTISRQDAIDAMTNTLWHYPNECYRNLNEYEFAKGLAELGLKSVPSAQPEIIHCGECRYKDDGINEDGIPFLKCLHGRSYGGTRINDFCSWAERRTDE